MTGSGPPALTLLPAVDVTAGAVARRGSTAPDDPASPLDVALRLQAEGATWLHLVDLDAAGGRGSNRALLAEVIDRIDLPVELAGGISDDESLRRALATGCARAVLGCEALAHPDWCANAIAEHGPRLAVNLDVREVTRAREVPPVPDVAPVQAGALLRLASYRLAPRGVRRDLGDLADLAELVERLDRSGCRRYVVTDVARDGALTGPNTALLRAVACATPARVVASGGIGSLDDLAVVAGVAATHPNVDAVVVGTALHAGRFTLRDAQRVLAH